MKEKLVISTEISEVNVVRGELSREKKIIFLFLFRKGTGELFLVHVKPKESIIPLAQIRSQWQSTMAIRGI